MVLNGQLRASAALQGGQGPRYLLDTWLNRPKSWSGCCRQGKISVPAGYRTPFPDEACSLVASKNYTINYAATSLTLLENKLHSPTRIRCTDGTHLAWRANPPWRRWQLLVPPHCRALPPPPSSVTNTFVSNYTKYQQTWNNPCSLRRAVTTGRYSARVKHLMARFQSRYFCGARWEARKSKITTTGINRLKT